MADLPPAAFERSEKINFLLTQGSERNSEVALLRYARNDKYKLLHTKGIVIARNEVTKQSEKINNKNTFKPRRGDIILAKSEWRTAKSEDKL